MRRQPLNSQPKDPHGGWWLSRNTNAPKCLRCRGGDSADAAPGDEVHAARRRPLREQDVPRRHHEGLHRRRHRRQRLRRVLREHRGQAGDSDPANKLTVHHQILNPERSADRRMEWKRGCGSPPPPQPVRDAKQLLYRQWVQFGLQQGRMDPRPAQNETPLGAKRSLGRQAF